MNIVLVNAVHPRTPHVAALRAARFAAELSRRGHDVVLVTSSAPEDADRDPQADVDTGGLRVVEVPGYHQQPAPPMLPSLRRIETAVRLFMDGGYQSAWVRAAVRALPPGFRPDVVWTTFGKLESVVVARRLARRFRTPWVLDLKDKWDLFIPIGLRRVLACRNRGWSAVTVNSAANLEQAARWHRGRAQVIYSGVDDAFLARSPLPADRRRFVINLVGSLYFPERVDEVLLGLRLWSEGLDPAMRALVELHYVGGDVAMLRDAVARSGIHVVVRAEGYLPAPRLAASCGHASVNAYVAFPGSFHHKLLELLACDRPLIAYPRESQEARELAARVGGELIEPASASELASALALLHHRWLQGGGSEPVRGCDRYSWPAQAALLEETLSRVAES
jgi:glycosyltransferase involved in cell wall biosynthesis